MTRDTTSARILRTMLLAAFLATTFMALAPQQAAAAVTDQRSMTTSAYPSGQCTWFVKLRRPEIPDTWGNAGTWAEKAVASKFGVSTYPVERAIAVFPPNVMGARGLGHVAFVTWVDWSRGYFMIDEANASGGRVVYYVDASGRSVAKPGYAISKRVIHLASLDPRVRFIRPRY